MIPEAIQSPEGCLQNPIFPKSKIYTSGNSDVNMESDAKHDAATVHTQDYPKPKPEKNQTFEFNNVASKHVIILFTPGTHYTNEIISNCGGKYRCYNCQRWITEQIFFYPTEYQLEEDTFLCSAIPHCAKHCALRTVHDVPNNFDLLSVFFLLYGSGVICAPPRYLLYVPGGLSIEEYHQFVQQGQVLNSESRLIRSFIAPMYISSTLLSGYQLNPMVVNMVDNDLNNHTSKINGTATPSSNAHYSNPCQKQNQNQNQSSIECQGRTSFFSKIARTFEVDSCLE